MAKTIAQIVTDTRQIIGQTVAANSAFSDDQLTVWINDGYQRALTELRHLPSGHNDYTVAAQAVTLLASTITVDNAKLLNPDTGDYDMLKPLSLDELVEEDPNYESATADMPQYFVRSDRATMLLYPPPKASVIAQTTPLRTYGKNIPDDMSADGDTPGLPPNLHPILSHWAAFRAFSALGDEPRATQQLTLFRGSLRDQKAISTEFSRRLKKFRWTTRL